MTLQRTELFVPLTAATPSGENREFRVTIISQSGPAHQFQTLEETGAAMMETPASNGKKNHEPTLSLQRDGERVTSIRIRCACGQTMDLACVYGEPSKK